MSVTEISVSDKLTHHLKKTALTSRLFIRYYTDFATDSKASQSFIASFFLLKNPKLTRTAPSSPVPKLSCPRGEQ